MFYNTIAQALRDQGITTIFGVLGDGNLFMIDSFQRDCGGKFYSLAGEAGTVLAANGYARTTGGLGVCSVTHGPGLTNTITALSEAARDHAPLLLIAGDTAMADRENVQDINHRAIVAPTGAGFEQVRSPATVCEDVARAVRRALSELRPIVLNVPVEFQWQDADYVEYPMTRTPVWQAVSPDSTVLEEAVSIVAAAKRPIVLAGRGATSAQAREALIAFARRIGAPLGTSLLSRDLFEGEPENIGIVGTLSHDVATQTIMAADTIIAFGASLNKYTTADGALLADRRVVQVDIDVTSLNHNRVTDCAVHGDSAVVAEAMIALLDQLDAKPTGFASPQLKQKLAERREDDFSDLSTDAHVDMRTALTRINSAFPRPRNLVFDIGRYCFNGFTLVHADAQDYVHALGFGAVGIGMANAVGAAVGSEKPTLLITGDGGFMLGGINEFNSAVRHRLDLVVVVLNDMAYGAEYIQFQNKNIDPSISTFDWPDLAPIADALGGEGYTVRNLIDLDKVLEILPNRQRPVLIDIKIDPDKVVLAGSFGH